MSQWLKLSMVALLAVAIVGCGDKPADKKDGDKAKTETAKIEGTTPVSLESDLCGKCGDAAGAATCCQGEKCDACGMQEGTALCCSGVAPKDATYCKGCGFEKGTDQCCSEENETCSGCGLAKGAPLCCKIKTGEKGHDHDHDDHDHDHDHEDGDDD